MNAKLGTIAIAAATIRANANAMSVGEPMKIEKYGTVTVLPCSPHILIEHFVVSEATFGELKRAAIEWAIEKLKEGLRGTDGD